MLIDVSFPMSGPIALVAPGPLYVGVESVLSATAIEDASHVDFSADGVLIENVGVEPWQCPWTPDAAGSVTLRARAYQGTTLLGLGVVVVEVLPAPEP